MRGRLGARGGPRALSPGPLTDRDGTRAAARAGHQDRDGRQRECFPFSILLHDQRSHGNSDADAAQGHLTTMRTIDEFLRLSMLAHVRHSVSLGRAAPAHAQLPLHVELVIIGTVPQPHKNPQLTRGPVARPRRLTIARARRVCRL